MLSCVISHLAAGAEVALPESIRVEGQPLRWKWSDGRQAVLMDEILDAGVFRVGIKTNMNSCTETRLPSCHFISHSRFRKLFLVWEKHPVDPTKIGKVLSLKNPETGAREDFAQNILVTQDVQVTWRQLGLIDAIGEELKMTLHCDQFEWLPGTAAGPLSETVVPAWTTHFENPVGEFFIPGIEQNPPVNHYTAGMKQVTLKRLDEGGYLVSSIAGFYTTVTHHASILRGYITSFFFDRDQFTEHPAKIVDESQYPNPGCEMEFILNFSEFYQQSNAKLKLRASPDYDSSKAKQVIFNRADPQVHLDSPIFQIEGEVE